MSRTAESRPSRENWAATAEQINKPSVSPQADIEADAAAFVAGAYVALVETTNGRFRRRVYFNLPSAQRAVDRAHATGHSAAIVLCQLVPVVGDAA